MKSLLYEKYHKNRKLQKRLIVDNDFTYRNLIHILNKNIKLNSKILDIGCGTGTIDFYLASKGCNVLGLDISENAIKIAKENSYNLGFDKKTKFMVSRFPKAKIDGKFDVVLCSEILEHLKDDKGAVASLLKLLTKNGVMIASSPSINAPLYRMGLLNNFDMTVGHLRRYSYSSYVSLFKQNGLKVVATFKTEGLLRNFLFTNRIAGELIRFIKGPISDMVTLIDNISIPLFGESQLFVVARKK